MFPVYFPLSTKKKTQNLLDTIFFLTYDTQCFLLLTHRGLPCEMSRRMTHLNFLVIRNILLISSFVVALLGVALVFFALWAMVELLQRWTMYFPAGVGPFRDPLIALIVLGFSLLLLAILEIVGALRASAKVLFFCAVLGLGVMAGFVAVIVLVQRQKPEWILGSVHRDKIGKEAMAVYQRRSHAPYMEGWDNGLATLSIDWLFVLIIRLIDWLKDWLVVLLIGRLIDWLIDCLIDCSFDWLIDRVSGWVIDWRFLRCKVHSGNRIFPDFCIEITGWMWSKNSWSVAVSCPGRIGRVRHWRKSGTRRYVIFLK